jgi:hypothetical protein
MVEPASLIRMPPLGSCCMYNAYASPSGKTKGVAMRQQVSNTLSRALRSSRPFVQQRCTSRLPCGCADVRRTVLAQWRCHGRGQSRRIGSGWLPRRSWNEQVLAERRRRHRSRPCEPRTRTAEQRSRRPTLKRCSSSAPLRSSSPRPAPSRCRLAARSACPRSAPSFAALRHVSRSAPAGASRG